MLSNLDSDDGWIDERKDFAIPTDVSQMDIHEVFEEREQTMQKKWKKRDIIYIIFIYILLFFAVKLRVQKYESCISNLLLVFGRLLRYVCLRKKKEGERNKSPLLMRLKARSLWITTKTLV